MSLRSLSSLSSIRSLSECVAQPRRHGLIAGQDRVRLRPGRAGLALAARLGRRLRHGPHSTVRDLHAGEARPLSEQYFRQWDACSRRCPAVLQAAGGSEGAGDHMAHMRWSQTGNMGALPNELMCVQPPWPAGVPSPLPHASGSCLASAGPTPSWRKCTTSATRSEAPKLSPIAKLTPVTTRSGRRAVAIQTARARIQRPAKSTRTASRSSPTRGIRRCGRSYRALRTPAPRRSSVRHHICGCAAASDRAPGYSGSHTSKVQARGRASARDSATQERLRPDNRRLRRDAGHLDRDHAGRGADGRRGRGGPAVRHQRLGL